jgi:DegV family protein with EDD domain
MANKVSIVTDTLTEMPEALSEQYDVRLIPMFVTLGGESMSETQIDREWYYSKLPHWKETGTVPLTSSIATGIFLNIFREEAAKARDIIYIGHSSKFGMSVSSSLQAKEVMREELLHTMIEVIDSYTVCGAQMLLVIEAARASFAGVSLSEIARLVDSLVKKVNYVCVTDDLTLLAKGGRIHRARPWADARITNTSLIEASFLTGGEMIPLSRYKTRPQALQGLFNTVAKRSGSRGLHVSINCTSTSYAEAEELERLVRARFDCVEIFITKLYPLVVN